MQKVDGHKPKGGIVTAKDGQGNTALSYATNSGVLGVVTVVATAMSRYLSAAQVRNTWNACFCFVF